MTATAPGAGERPEDSYAQNPEGVGRETTNDLDTTQGTRGDPADRPMDIGGPDDPDQRPSGRAAAPSGAAPAPGGVAADEPPVRLLEADELQSVVSRWREIQAEFVDQPKRAMQDADALVSDLMDRLTRTFAEQRQQLEARWSSEESISTEDLRQGLQRYRSFFERLLAA